MHCAFGTVSYAAPREKKKKTPSLIFCPREKVQTESLVRAVKSRRRNKRGCIATCPLPHPSSSFPPLSTCLPPGIFAPSKGRGVGWVLRSHVVFGACRIDSSWHGRFPRRVLNVSTFLRFIEVGYSVKKGIDRRTGGVSPKFP